MEIFPKYTYFKGKTKSQNNTYNIFQVMFKKNKSPHMLMNAQKKVWKTINKNFNVERRVEHRNTQDKGILIFHSKFIV